MIVTLIQNLCIKQGGGNWKTYGLTVKYLLTEAYGITVKCLTIMWLTILVSVITPDLSGFII